MSRRCYPTSFRTKISAATFSKSITAALLVFLTLLVVACGRVGDPLPPIKNRALVPEALKVAQRGDALLLTWPKPGSVALESSRVTRAEILRRDERADDPLRLPEERFLEEARVIGSIKTSEMVANETRTLQFADPLPSGQAGNQNNEALRYRYAIRYVKASGAPLPLSNYAVVEPFTKVARPPKEVKLEQTQESIKLSWPEPAANIDDSTPPFVIGYNIYRRSKNQVFDKPLNSVPVNATSYEDRQFKFGNEYYYQVRSVSQGKEAAIESPPSPEFSIVARDTFAPVTTTNITGAAAGGIVSLFWPANTERDLKGYLVYRAERKDQPRAEWQLLTRAPITTTTFRDDRAQAGKTYYYYILAVDDAGNESSPSEAVEVEVVQ